MHLAIRITPHASRRKRGTRYGGLHTKSCTCQPKTSAPRSDNALLGRSMRFIIFSEVHLSRVEFWGSMRLSALMSRHA